MKNYLLLVLLFILFYNHSWSQCTPVDCPSAPSLLPFGGICGDVIPTGTINVPYVEQESFRLTNTCFNPADFDSTQVSVIVRILHIRAFMFSGLPVGLTAQTDMAQYNTGSTPVVGCVAVSGTPTEAGLFAATIDVTAKLRSWLIGGCNGFLPVDIDQPFSFSLDLIILPNASFTGLSPVYCDNDAAVTLTSTGSHPGTFSGPGVTGTQFSPALAGPGIHQIIQTVTAQDAGAIAPATNRDTITVTVYPSHEITINATTCDPGQAGTVIQDLSTGQGCDSTITTITTLDNTPPTALCQNITVQLDAGANASIAAAAIDNGSSDACGVSLSLDTTSFTCVDLGGNPVVLTVTDGAGNSSTCSASVTVEDPLTACNPCPETQDVAITAGWNIISSNIQPDVPDMLTVLQDISSDIIILKDATGAVVIPAIPLNSIGNWLVTEGYKVKASNPATLTIGCAQVDPALTPISLTAGWDIVPFLRSDTMDAAVALASLGTDLIIAKNNGGDIYFPALSINNIGALMPGQGYQVKMAAPGMLTYPANTVRHQQDTYTDPGVTRKYVVNGNTGNNATIVIPNGAIEELEYGDEIGVFTGLGELAGSAVYQKAPLALTVWGNDQTGTEERLMLDGEPFHYKVWRAGAEEMDMVVEYSKGESHFIADGVSIISKASIGDEPDLNLASKLFVYPNPTRSQLNMEVWLPEASDVNVRLFDVSGKEVRAMVIKGLENGYNLLRLDISELEAGEYFYRMATNIELFNGEVIKMR